MIDVCRFDCHNGAFNVDSFISEKEFFLLSHSERMK